MKHIYPYTETANKYFCRRNINALELNYLVSVCVVTQNNTHNHTLTHTPPKRDHSEYSHQTHTHIHMFWILFFPLSFLQQNIHIYI